MARIKPENRKKKYVPRLKPEENYLYHFAPRDAEGKKVDLFCTFQRTLDNGRYLFENIEYHSDLQMSPSRFAYLMRFNFAGKTFIKPKEQPTENLEEAKGLKVNNVLNEQDNVEFEDFIKSGINQLKNFTQEKAEDFEKKTGHSVIKVIVDMSNYLKSDKLKDNNDVPYFTPLLALATI